MSLYFPKITQSPEQQAAADQEQLAMAAQYDALKEHIYSCKHPIMQACARLLMDIQYPLPDEDPMHIHHLFAVNVNAWTYQAVRKARDEMINPETEGA
jgi:hypothetical protein